MLGLIKKILTHQNRIGRDKLAHFYSGALGFALFCILINTVWASVIVINAGVFKEIYDIITGKGKGEVLDAFFTSLPVILYWLVVIF
mgnify:CR=1 FL=1